MILRENPVAELNFLTSVTKPAKLFFESHADLFVESDEDKKKAPYVSITTDGRYLYIFSSVEGILKVGTGY